MTIPLRGALKDEPLVGKRLLRRALAAVTFSPVLKINERTGEYIAGFQEAVRRDYPTLEMDIERSIGFELQADGSFSMAPQENIVWRMLDREGLWKVSLTAHSVGLEVGEGYTTRQDFAERMKRLVAHVHTHFQPAELLRMGVRYVNAAEIHNDSDPREDCDPSLVSLVRHQELMNADFVWRFHVDEGQLLLRSGVLMPGLSHDLGVMQPVSERSWYLDIDVSNQVAQEFHSDHIKESVASLVRRAHAVYSWAIPHSQPPNEGTKS